MGTIILQRVIPHFRVPLFERLHDRFGWIVATGPPSESQGLSLVAGERPWLRRFDFTYSRHHNYRTRVPIDAVLEQTRADAVLAEFALSMSSTWRLARDAALRRDGRPQLAFWSHGPNVERGFRKPGDIASQMLRLGMLAAADANVCYTGEGALYLRRWLPSGKPVFVAQNTVDIETFPGRDINLSPSDPTAPNVLFVGRLTPDKQVPLLISAFRELHEVVPGATLTVIGDGPDMPRVHAAAAGLGGSIQILGSLYDSAQVSRHFQSASLFAYAGSIGLAANQALAYGVPVIIFDDPGRGARHHPEHSYVVDGVTGYRVAEPTASAFAQRMIAVLSQNLAPRALLERSIGNYVAEHLQLDRMVSAFAELDAFFRSRATARPSKLYPAI